MIVITKNAQDTQKIGENLASQLHWGAVLLLYGNLGVGKTTFVQGLAKGLGIEKRVISPTFTIVRSHKIKNKTFYHVDLYRLETKEAVKSSGILELLEQKDSIIAIEWPERMGSLIPKSAWILKFELLSDVERRIEISKLT